ncbi:hypothetical protein DXG03_002614 [Asterophora parasitica]|uniref:Uncharacterized protein n=1 Tax=Asterophora parasitica TaxID=117018 RepID=A0A9P7G5I8_9AGAR|nr:hypothetical protein DXG03_002614 [Asterophora parasitica]
MKFSILTSAASLLVLGLGAHAQVASDSGSATILPTTGLPGDSSLPPVPSGTEVVPTDTSTDVPSPSSVSASDTVIDTATETATEPTPTDLPASTSISTELPTDTNAASTPTTSSEPAATSNAAFTLSAGQGGTFVAVLGGIAAAIL